MKIQIDDLSDGQVEALLVSHLAQMHQYSPKDSVHALDVAAMRLPDMTFWSARQDDAIMGCGALKQLDKVSGELKSMKTSLAFLRMGVAEALLQEIIAVARGRGYQQLYLETGSHDAFIPAVKLYQKYGFEACLPFADYQPDSFSRFFSKAL